MAVGVNVRDFLMRQLEFQTDYLHEIEQTMLTTMESSLKEMEHRLHQQLTIHVNNINEKMESKMHGMENSLKKIVEASEENMQAKLKELKNHMIPKMDRIQETLQTELKKLEANKEILDMLTNSIHNLTTNAETRSNTLEDHLIAPISSCREAPLESGTYLFRLSKNSNPFEVFCEQNKFDGGWIVIQHRYDGSVDFYRNWTEYRDGFGTLDGEFWLGLEYVHQITKNRPHELLVEIEDFHGNYGYAKYDRFEVGSECEQYELKKLGTYSGTATDSMYFHTNNKFSTFDRDNDPYYRHCAKDYHGAWWYRSCHRSNLNGRYLNATDDSAMNWYHFKTDMRGLSYSRMMIREITP